MGFQNIEKKSFGYFLLHRVLVAPWHNFIFFRKIYINFQERVPKDDHLILTPNHQNALLDAMAPVCNIDRQLVFLARSDIFKKKKVASILYFLKILPVFRLRDGLSSVKKNSKTFDKTVDVIKAKNALAILPEGDYLNKHQLRPLKKGFARIAFQTEEASNFKLDLKIVPVGLHYSDYNKVRSDLIINYGQAIAVSDYYELYKESPAVAINKITAALTDALKAVILDLPDEDYDFYNNVIRIYCSYVHSGNSKLPHDISLEQATASNLENLKSENPEKFNEVKTVYANFKNQVNKAGVEKEEFYKLNLKPFQLIMHSLALVIGIPFFIYGSVNNLLPFLLTEFFVKKIKDVTFKNSFRFVISFIVFEIFYIIQTLFIFFFIDPWWIALLYAAILPLSLIFTINYTKELSRIFYNWKLLFLSLRKSGEFKNLKSSYNQLISLVGKL